MLTTMPQNKLPRTDTRRAPPTLAAAIFVAALTAACAVDPGQRTQAAQSQNGDKSGYHLFNPTPRQQWRPMSSDRPDVTESPITVDAGAMQAELSFVDYAKAGGDRTVSAMPTNYKIGLTNNMDLQLVLEPYVDAQDGPVNSDGFGLTQLRWKINLWGNDGGDTALGIMPFIQAPTASTGLGSDRVEGGLIIPFATSLTEGVGLGLMLEGDLVYDEVDDDHEVEVVATAVVGVDITDALAGYVESISISGVEANADFRQIIGVGLTYTVNPDVIFDVGTNTGITGDDTDDFNAFAGVTFRL